MSSLGSPNPFFIAGKKAYEVERSLRFNDDDSTYLQRQPSSSTSGSTQKITISFWIKIGNIPSGTNGGTFFGSSGNTHMGQFFNQTLYFDVVSTYWINTTGVFRDPSAWYHVVYAVDTTQSTSTNRQKIYVNGVLQDRGDTVSDPSQNAYVDYFNNSSTTYYIGRRQAGNYFDGYLAEINFLDGYVYDPSYFGQTDAITGQWNPKKYTGSYGTNGFYLNFSDNSGTTATTLGKDLSGNSNNFTPNNFAVSDAVPDTPTNNFCTINAVGENLLVSGSTPTFSEGNLKSVLSGNGYGTYWKSTFGMTSGKWYWEILAQNAGSFANIGVNNFRSKGSTAGTGVFYQSNGYRNPTTQNTGTTSYGASYTTGDIIGVAFDADSESVTFYKNNSSQGAVGSVLTQANAPYFAAVGDGNNGQQYTFTANFGQDSSFAGEKTAQGNTDGSGQGDFYYAPPSGFLALCSANLPEPTIKLPNKHFDNLLYTGTGSSNAITGLNFAPNWTWIKSRSLSSTHKLMDSVRGDGLTLASNNNNAEASDSSIFSSLDSSGFTVTGTANSTNASSATYVAWNWNGGDTDGKSYAVTVVSDSGNKYRFDGFGTSAVTLDLAEGGTYIFNYPSAHPFRFSTTSDGTHGGGSEYTTGVTHNSSTQVTIVVAASAPTLYYYCSIHSGMGGQVNTNSTLGSSNFDGTIQSTVKANTTAGFSVVTYTGNHTSGATVGHGLGATPNSLIVKARGTINGQNRGWNVYHVALGNTKYVQLSSNATSVTNSAWWNNTTPNSTTFTLGNDYDVNANISGGNYVAYVFSEVAGYSKFGSYTGNGNADGTFVFTGFKPALVILKNTNTVKHWGLFDNKRIGFNVENYALFPSDTSGDDTSDYIDFLSNGFKLRSTALFLNKSGDEIIYLAFAESPFKNARAR